MLREVRGDLEFRNELLRAQAYYAIAAPARQHLHRQVAELLVERPAEQRQSLQLEIAWHFLRGGDVARALSFGIDGSEQALAVGAPYEAEQILLVLQGQRSAAGSAEKRIRFLLSRALLDQSKAEHALPILTEVLADPELSPRELADATRMRAAAQYLLDRDPLERYCQATDEALAAARRLSDARLTALALFECARAGAELGEDRRVESALNELLALSEEPVGANDPVVLHALGFCYFFFSELKRAAGYLERAIDVLRSSSDSVTLNYVYNGLGMCRHYLCEIGPAEAAYFAGFNLARKIGDESRASIIAANLCGIKTHEGDYADAIKFGCYCLEAASRGRSPRLVISYTNLAEAYMLNGDSRRAAECLEKAKKLVEEDPRWYKRVEFVTESANLALLASDIALALDRIGMLEKLTSGRERAVHSLGIIEKLKIFKAGHVGEPVTACTMAQQAKERFRNRNVMFYLQTLAAQAWAERRAHGGEHPKTEHELKAFEAPGLAGLKASLVGQGFLL